MTQNLLVPMPEPDDFGPAMRACTTKERAFVVAYFHTGKRELAAQIAGYAGEAGSNQLGVSAFQVWHRPRVQQAIQEFASTSILMGLVPMATAVMQDVLERGDHKEKLKAAQMVFDRTGFHALQEVKVTKIDGTDREAKVRKLIALAKKLGKNPRDLIGNLADVVDADFAAVEAAEEVVSSSEGLEDLL